MLQPAEDLMNKGPDPGSTTELPNSGPLAEAKALEADAGIPGRPLDPDVEVVEWPSLARMLRTTILLAVGLVFAVWILSALNPGT
jgi:hypothetical protein